LSAAGAAASIAAMSLTIGTGPFGHAPAGVFNAPLPREGLLYFESSPRRVRGLLADETVVDSRRVRVLHEHGRLPRYYFPQDDVRTDLLERSGRTTDSPGKGTAVHLRLRAAGRTVEDAAWTYPEPPPGAPPLAGHVAFFWEALDEWLEEDEPVLAHARDPYHRVDALPTSRHVRASLGGETIADSARTTVIFETGLVPRWYFPREDVGAELVASHLQTACAYKGQARYWSVRTRDGALHENVAWTYDEPRRDAAPVAGLVAFFDEHVDLEVDGDRLQRPDSPWARPGWWADAARLEERL
jgi:uncharacterized protein (DUF427 family)